LSRFPKRKLAPASTAKAKPAHCADFTLSSTR
jgi:hypothetical protein